MKLQKKIISAIVVGVSLSMITCSKNETPTKTTIVKTASGQDSVVHISDCPACGKG